MTKGIDYSYSRPNIAQLKRDGIKFACRYLSYNPAKNLTRSEANALMAAGISPVSNWEDKAGDMLGGYSRGVAYAKEADKQHRQCGGPPDAPIYFSVDFDANTSQLKTCYDFLRGAASVLGWKRIGVYGGYRSIEWMAQQSPRPAYYWQTYAWSGGRWSKHANIRQWKNNVHYAGGYVDHNTAMTADFGQWTASRDHGDLIGLEAGDTGERVKALQYMLRRAGFDGQTTGKYDAQTAQRVLRMRKSQGSNATDGNKMTGAAVDQLMAALIKKLT